MISVGYEHMQSVDPRCSLGALEMESTGVWHRLGRCPRSCQRSGLVRLELHFFYGIYRCIYSFHGFITNTLLTLLMEVGKKPDLISNSLFVVKGYAPDARRMPAASPNDSSLRVERDVIGGEWGRRRTSENSRVSVLGSMDFANGAAKPCLSGAYNQSTPRDILYIIHAFYTG